MDMSDYLVTSELLDCAGRTTHRLTLQFDGTVEVEMGQVVAVVDPLTRAVLRPTGVRLPDQVLDEALVLLWDLPLDRLAVVELGHSRRQHEVDAERSVTHLAADLRQLATDLVRKASRRAVNAEATGVGDRRHRVDAVGEAEDRRAYAESLAQSVAQLGVRCPGVLGHGAVPWCGTSSASRACASLAVSRSVVVQRRQP